MEPFRGKIHLLAALVLFGCAADDSVKPPDASDIVRNQTNESYAAMTRGDILVKTNGAPAKVYCLDATSCYAVAFDFTDYDNDPETGRPYTIFTAYFQNLEGTYPSDGPGTLLALDLFRFQFFDTIESPDFVDASNMVLSAIGNVIVGLGNVWIGDSPTAGRNSHLWDALGFGIVGCTAPGGPPLISFAFQTCPRDGIDGWVKVDFKLQHRGSALISDPVRFHDFVFAFGHEGGIPPGPFCKVGGNEPNPCDVRPYRSVIR